ncbi:MAG: methyl-accepting chemotaxis protein [Beijerinckiaceae bacterium]|jgi:methyl-accepting chemotaxis protein
MHLRNFKIGTRLAAGFAVVMVLMIGIAGTANLFGAETNRAVSDVQRTNEFVRAIKDEMFSLRSARALAWYYVATGDKKALADRDRVLQKFTENHVAVDTNAKSEAERKMMMASYEAALENIKAQDGIIGLKNKGADPASDEYRRAIAAVNAAQDKYIAASEVQVQHENEKNDGYIRNANQALNQSSFWMLLISLCGILAGIAAAWVIGRGISGPVKAMTDAMEKLANGDLAREIPALSNKDEIGAMAKAVQIFKNNGLKLRDSEAEAARQRASAEQERAANEAARVEIQRQQEAVVASIAAGLERLSKGDLTNRLNQAFSAEYEKLRADFNATADSLQEALRTIAAATTGISTGSDQIAHASDDLSRRTEQQAASLEETAAALNIITDTVRSMATGAAEAAKVVVTTRGAAETSGAIVQQAVEAMGKIKDSSNQISNIIGVIDEIAFQTNLLALNAGVEAARAGDAGRGFAVVASEVRALAQRSAEAAKEIKSLISASTVQVDSGVVLVDKTGLALKDIIAKVAEMDALVRKISASSQEQATGIAEINTAVAQMDQVVQQNAAMVEESTAAAHALKSETQDLSTMVGKFQIETRGTRPAARENPVHAAQAKLAKSVRPAMKTTSQVKAAPDKDWQEF